MALPTTYRWVSIGKLKIRNQAAAPAEAPRFALADLIRALRGVEAQPRGVRSFQNNDRRMWCAPIGEDDDYFFILVQAGDKNVSDVAFIDFETFSSRDGGKLESEGGHFCGHVIIKKVPDAVGKHLVLVEKVPSIHFSSLKAHFNWILSNHAEVKRFEVDGSVKQYRGTTEIEGYQSKTLRQAMTTGTVQEIEFIGNQRLDEGVDEEDQIQETVHEVHWKVRRRLDGAGAQRLVTRAFNFMRGWEDVERDSTQLLVRIKAENGQVKTAEVTASAAEVEAATQEALENAFYLNEIINRFDAPLTQRYDALRADVLGRLKERAENIEA